MNLNIRFTAAGAQYLVDLLKTRPIGEAGELFEDVRAQIREQEAADVAEQRAALIARHIAEQAKEPVAIDHMGAP